MKATHQSARLPDGRLHLQEGPIDLVIAAFGRRNAVEAAYARAQMRFDGLLRELVAELDLLRTPLGERPPALKGTIARRMAQACWPFREAYITPMAAVAGAVADEVLEAMVAGDSRLNRVYVNNGGDIAIHLRPGKHLDIGVVRELSIARPEGFVRIAAETPVRGVATSGRHGRSFSRGIADAVTVLARSAADADAAATIIANAVDIEDAAIVRRPAQDLDPDSDLGNLLVTVGVGPLAPHTVARALDEGVLKANQLLRAGLIEGALLALGREWRSVGGGEALITERCAS